MASGGTDCLKSGKDDDVVSISICITAYIRSVTLRG